MEKVSAEWLNGFKSYQDWYESLRANSKKNEISSSLRNSYDSILRTFIKFKRAGGDQDVTPDSIVEWAKKKSEAKEGKEVVAELSNFSLWLQGEDVEGYEKRVPYVPGRFASQVSADGVAHGGLRGFFTHNQILLPKSGRRKRNGRSKVKKNDENYAIFKPGKNGKEIADYELFRQFLSTLNIHDQTIIMSMLSTSQDSADVLGLNIGFVTDQSESKRLFWAGERGKTNEDFRTFFSVEASNMVRRYVKQERKGAGKDDPLFVRTKGRRLTPKNIAENCKNAAQKMGLINGDTQNPFRPKRMRSIFRSACSIAGIEKGYVNVFMGHKTDISDSYMEKPRATLELRYEMVEAYLKVYAGDMNQDIVEMKEKVTEYSERQEKAFDLMFDVREDNKRLMAMVENLAERLGRTEAFIEALGYDPNYETGEVKSIPKDAHVMTAAEKEKYGKVQKE